MRMNTDSRRNVFCVLMSGEDYLDATERLVKLGTRFVFMVGRLFLLPPHMPRNQLERDVLFVVTDCVVQVLVVEVEVFLDVE
jgi:hypothetical protein